VIILFVGSHPSISAKTYNPFCRSTRSGQILSQWIEVAELNDRYPYFCNTLDTPTENNKPLTMSDIKNSLPRLKAKIDIINPTRVVAVGKTAAKALSMLGVQFYEMPHPSGCNRLLNVPGYVAGKIKGLQLYCSPQEITSKN
jgi:uracil-DNA glycosylase family 4